MVTRLILKLGHLPGADMFLSFIGRRILGAFSLIRTAILVMGIANILLFQYLDSAEAQERNKLAEQGKLDHLSFVVQTQIQSYESAVWQTGRLPGTISSARDLYTAQASNDLQALRKLDQSILAPGGALHSFIQSYLGLQAVWQAIVPTIEQGGDTGQLRVLWTNQRAAITGVPVLLDDYRRRAQRQLAALHQDKQNAKQVAMGVSMITSLISFALSIALAITLTRQIVPPVTRLRDALQQIATGDLSPRAQVRGKDEISELLSTFNSSVVSLHNLLAQVRGHAQGISAESRRLRQVYSGELVSAGEIRSARPESQPATREHLAPATVQVRGESARAEPGSRDREQVETAESINQLIEQVAQVAHNASLLAESARQAAAAASPNEPAFSPLASNLRELDDGAREMAEQLRILVLALHRAQNRVADSTGSLDRAAEDLRQAIEQFRLQSEDEVGREPGSTTEKATPRPIV